MNIIDPACTLHPTKKMNMVACTHVHPPARESVTVIYELKVQLHPEVRSPTPPYQENYHGGLYPCTFTNQGIATAIYELKLQLHSEVRSPGPLPKVVFYTPKRMPTHGVLSCTVTEAITCHMNSSSPPAIVRLKMTGHVHRSCCTERKARRRREKEDPFIMKT